MPQLKGSIPWNKGKGMPPIEKFWSKVQKTESCWIWTGEKRIKNYGYLIVNGKDVRAHRFSYELHKGAIPPGMLVCHACDNPSCVRPDHLWLGTHKDNAMDKARKGRQPCLRGEKNSSCKLKWEDVEKIRYMYKTTNLKQLQIAKLFSVSLTLVNGILNNKKRINE